MYLGMDGTGVPMRQSEVAGCAGKQPDASAIRSFTNKAPVHAFQSVSAAGGIKLMARSVTAQMVRLGLTPRLAARTEPSQMYIFL